MSRRTPKKIASMSIPENLKASEVASIAFVLICCFAASLGMAFNIDGIKESFNLTNAYAGRLISLEMLSIALGNFFFARITHKTNSKTVFLSAQASSSRSTF